MPESDPHDRQPPCAAGALWGIRKIAVREMQVGIAGLCDAVCEVQNRNLTRDDEIRAALVDAVSRQNYIPDPLREAYGEALLAEYYAVLKRYDKSTKRPV